MNKESIKHRALSILDIIEKTGVTKPEAYKHLELYHSETDCLFYDYMLDNDFVDLEYYQPICEHCPLKNRWPTVQGKNVLDNCHLTHKDGAYTHLYNAKHRETRKLLGRLISNAIRSIPEESND